MKLYLAGSLFNEAEIAQRLLDAKKIRATFNNLEVFNPIEQPFNEDKSTLPSPQKIYEGDTAAVLDSDIFIADMTNDDPGVLVELGIAIMSPKKPIIICINSDIRLKDANRYNIPSYSMNHYVLGGILKHGHLVFSIDEAIDKLKELLK
ncbi:nucleoside 2-deoxyribosyltransferase [[Mycoplasma] testudinis]|uniref:nucleoside 2-deoxyribosyltransferase n=1 Tax=[Mycoplasma] testudinis TaxID=33924 RepID=UPI00048315B8|nr:nucleoside 2-deoxyribosyltransferase [[Mycoplasma] testudinis]